MNDLMLIGLAVVLGTVSGHIFKTWKIPQVVGYIILGLLIGKSFLHIFEGEVVDSLTPLVNFTLGIIGCVIGSELKGSVFKRYGSSIYTILCFEGILAFLCVCAAVTAITGKLYLGLILGAIASATDPASTVSVLWEYKAKGPLTRTVTSIIALDDALALMIYGLVSVFSKTLILDQQFSWWHGVGAPLMEIGLCLVLGVIAGFIFVRMIRHITEETLKIAFFLGLIAAGVGLSVLFELDLILFSMAFGATVSNMIPKFSDMLFSKIREMTTSLYILFFVSIGAQLDIHIFMNIAILSIVAMYLLARSAGKIAGASFGAWITRSDPAVVRYTGVSLFAQGGVAMGLALSISHSLSLTGAEGQSVGNVIINVVAATTFVVQIAGPALVKWAVMQAKENDRRISEDDLIQRIHISEVMDRQYPLIQETTPLSAILNTFSDSPYTQFPVINKDGFLTGVINIDSIKNTISLQETENLLIAEDMKFNFDHKLSYAHSLYLVP
jgi:Kef-type K+ transport system membrane component KefB